MEVFFLLFFKMWRNRDLLFFEFSDWFFILMNYENYYGKFGI